MRVLDYPRLISTILINFGLPAVMILNHQFRMMILRILLKKLSRFYKNLFPHYLQPKLILNLIQTSFIKQIGMLAKKF